MGGSWDDDVIKNWRGLGLAVYALCEYVCTIGCLLLFFLPMGENVQYCGWCPAVRGPLLYVGLQQDGHTNHSR